MNNVTNIVRNHITTIDNNGVTTVDFSISITNNGVNINKSITFSINKQKEFINNIIKEESNVQQLTINNRKIWEEERKKLREEMEENTNNFWKEQEKKRKELKKAKMSLKNILIIIKR